jgi:hypothetical protein
MQSAFPTETGGTDEKNDQQKSHICHGNHWDSGLMSSVVPEFHG